MRMASNGHNNTLWKFIVSYPFPFVNFFFDFFPTFGRDFLLHALYRKESPWNIMTFTPLTAVSPAGSTSGAKNGIPENTALWSAFGYMTDMEIFS